MEMYSKSGNKNITRELRYNQPLTIPFDGVAVCKSTLRTESSLRITNLSRDKKATFIVVSESECDGTYTLPSKSPGHQWTCTTNFQEAKVTVTNLSPGAASIEVVLLDMTGEY
jgi:hypothetical protein